MRQDEDHEEYLEHHAVVAVVSVVGGGAWMSVLMWSARRKCVLYPSYLYSDEIAVRSSELGEFPKKTSETRKIIAICVPSFHVIQSKYISNGFIYQI